MLFVFSLQQDFYSPPYVYIDDPETIPECLVDRVMYTYYMVDAIYIIIIFYLMQTVSNEFTSVAN